MRRVIAGIITVVAVILLMGWIIQQVTVNQRRPPQSARTAAQTMMDDIAKNAIELHPVIRWTQERGSTFGAFQIKNDAGLPIHNIELLCEFTGRSGTQSGQSEAISDVIPPKSTRVVSRIQVAAISKPFDRASCTVTKASFAEEGPHPSR